MVAAAVRATICGDFLGVSEVPYKPVSSFKGLEAQLAILPAMGPRAAMRQKAALVAAYAARVARHPKIRADLAKQLAAKKLARYRNTSASRPLIRALYQGLNESNYTRLAQLCDRAVRSRFPSAKVYAAIIEEGLDTKFRRKLRRKADTEE